MIIWNNYEFENILAEEIILPEGIELIKRTEPSKSNQRQSSTIENGFELTKHKEQEMYDVHPQSLDKCQIQDIKNDSEVDFIDSKHDNGKIKRCLNDEKMERLSEKCPKCNYSTKIGSIMRRLLRHIKVVHQKIKDFVYPECGYTTAHKFVLSNHIKKNHQN